MHPQKVLVAGDAGAMITSDPKVANLARRMRHHGLRTRDVVEQFAHNSRLDSIQAAVLNVKLDYLDRWVARWRESASRYCEELKDLPLTLPLEQEGEFRVYYLFTIQTDRRDELAVFLHERGIDARIHYPTLISEQPAAARVGLEKRLPVARSQVERILSLPIYHSMTDAELSDVAQCVRAFYQM